MRIGNSIRFHIHFLVIDFTRNDINTIPTLHVAYKSFRTIKNKFDDRNTRSFLQQADTRLVYRERLGGQYSSAEHRGWQFSKCDF